MDDTDQRLIALLRQDATTVFERIRVLNAKPNLALVEPALRDIVAACPELAGIQAARVWADVAQHLGIRARRGKAVNLDPAALLMDMVLKLEETAGSLAHR